MAIIVSANEGQGYTPIEEGVYMALCYGLVDLGDVFSEQYNKCSPRFTILWELVGAGTIKLEDGREINRSISKTYGKSLGPKSNLRKDLRAWRGREFTDEELAKFDMASILGVPCQIQIVNSTSNEKTYSNIAAIMNLPKGMPKPQPTQDILKWDFDENTLDDEAWNALPNWLREQIMKSETYTYITTDNPGHMNSQRLADIRETASYTSYRAKMGDFPPAADDDDELPF